MGIYYSVYFNRAVRIQVFTDRTLHLYNDISNTYNCFYLGLNRKTMGKQVTKDLKHLPMDAKSFTANGHEYVISQGLSVDRWRKYEELQIELGFGTNLQSIFTRVKEAYGYLNEVKIADAAVILHNIMWGVKDRLENRVDKTLLMCALFMNRKEGEDVTKYDEDFMEEKIKDWAEEGYDTQSFFHIAWNLVPGFFEAFNEDLAPILKKPSGKGTRTRKKR